MSLYSYRRLSVSFVSCFVFCLGTFCFFQSAWGASAEIEKFLKENKLDESKILKEVLENNELAEAKPNDYQYLTWLKDKNIKYVGIDKENGRKPVFIDKIMNGHFVKNNNEHLIIVNKDALSHAEGFIQLCCAVYDISMNKKISKTVYFAHNAKIVILRGKQCDHLLVSTGDCQQGYCYWQIDLAFYKNTDEWDVNKMLYGVYTDDSPDLLKYIKDNKIVTELPPEVSYNGIIFPTKKYIWSFDTEKFELKK